MGKYKVWNGPAPTTAALASVASGTTIKTMQQLKAGASKGLIITGWGYSLDTEQAAAGEIELVKTNAAATVTAYAAGDVVALSTPSAASSISLGVAASGYTASVEGTVASTVVYDAVRLPVSTTASPALFVARVFDKDDRPYLSAGGILRIRATLGTSAGMTSWISYID
jgi:hypothetical protein